METISDFICLFIGIGLLAVIAFPERFIPAYVTKTKKVGASYWGMYEGESPETEEERTLSVKVVKRKAKVIGGGTQYATGKSISFRGSG